MGTSPTHAGSVNAFTLSLIMKEWGTSILAHHWERIYVGIPVITIFTRVIFQAMDSALSSTAARNCTFLILPQAKHGAATDICPVCIHTALVSLSRQATTSTPMQYTPRALQ